MHPAVHLAFEASRLSPLFGGAGAMWAVGLALSDKQAAGKRLAAGLSLGFAGLITIALAAFALIPGHDAGYDLFGAALWLGIAFLISIAALAVIHLKSLFTHGPNPSDISD